MSKSITIGCDPEWGIIKDGGIVSASSVIRNSNAQFGVDGCGRVAELRPTHSTSPQGLVDNIRAVLKDGYESHEHLRPLKWKAGGMVLDEPIGGHIHFGASKLCAKPSADKVSAALDRTLSVLCLMVEDSEEAINRRIGSSYGQLGGNQSYRSQPWGMEYRVLASWLTAPDEALAVLSLAFLIASEYDDADIMEEAASLPAFDTQSFKECDKIGLMYYIAPIVEFIRKLPDFKKHEKEIAPLFRLIKNQQIWSCHKNMVDTWELAPKKAKLKGVTEYV